MSNLISNHSTIFRVQTISMWILEHVQLNGDVWSWTGILQSRCMAFIQWARSYVCVCMFFSVCVQVVTIRVAYHAMQCMHFRLWNGSRHSTTHIKQRQWFQNITNTGQTKRLICLWFIWMAIFPFVLAAIHNTYNSTAIRICLCVYMCVCVCVYKHRLNILRHDRNKEIEREPERKDETEKWGKTILKRETQPTNQPTD